MSDHAAVKCEFAMTRKRQANRSKITRLDPRLAKDAALMLRLKEELNAMTERAPANSNPHLKLQYLKMCTRTVWEKFQAEHKRTENDEEANVNDELNKAINSLGKEDLHE